MNITTRKILSAFLLGLLVPWTWIKIGNLLYPEHTNIADTAPSTQTTDAVERPVVISVWSDNAGVSVMELEEYLVGVILAEMPTSFEPEALKAQAVVARTYALKRAKEMRHQQGAVCTDAACCQAYVSNDEYLNGLGYAEDIQIARSAVTATAGMVITYDGELAETTYFHSSGGMTENAVAVWGTEYPYLQSVESPGEEMMEHYQAEVYYDESTLEQLLGRQLSGTPKSWLGWTTYTTGGGVHTMQFAGQQYSGVELRAKLQLNSTSFNMTADDGGITIKTLGKGHRVGMSQCGAQAMALTGSSCREILAHYYPGTRIDKFVDVR